ncbi:class I SAM-dependent methyltransferase [Cumulibacter soli]|uniref:class I SAM-dependent methyltransferase n=1 Tax=Cumulibacter soli TaxID=2546344 RepID=UPI0010680709|nr:class I SAM-dependent methyltransferase [Cumulibacter soli]
MPFSRVRDAYTARSAEYINLFGTIDSAAAADRQFVLDWATGLDGPVIDVGCGPGQWTNFLAQNSIDVRGIDPVSAFVDAARQRYPTCTFSVGRAEQLELADASVGGILAWCSLIHTAPHEIAAALDEFARCLRPHGGLALGFFEGPELVAFEHAVTTAYYWPMDELASRVQDAGFVVTDGRARTDPGVRRQGMLTARRGS